MTRVLLLGYEPTTVDFSDPALPPGMTVEKVHAGIQVALKQFASHGWEADVGFIRPDEREELGAIIAGMKHMGWAPYISRLA